MSVPASQSITWLAERICKLISAVTRRGMILNVSMQSFQQHTGTNPASVRAAMITRNETDNEK